ncbi:MAG: hypothetical protein DME23_16675 [Verrucomicrobia bacterium]|nr:MAG: hypothetical protein DME23_16675 [Verrucomicrobiota bacterium]
MSFVPRYFQWPAAAVILFLSLCPPRAAAQITNTVFFDDFADGVIDANKYQPDAPFFEGGQGDIHATEANGVLEFTGTVSQQWWAGATLRIVPTFTVSDETNVVISVDRVSEAGVGTSSRSALWTMDSTRSTFVLFADNRGENHWEYNRKINEAGDQPTGGGVAITAFDDPLGPFLDEGLHRMKAVANGKTVKLYLDDVFGAEVKFPFTNLVFQIGSYARATGDTADTTFDNLRVETVGTATFSTTSLTLTAGQSAPSVTVRIPPGANATTAIQVRVVSSDPAVAIPVGGTGGTLTLTFTAGGSNTKTFDVQALGVGGAQFTLQDDIGLAAGNALDVTVVSGPGLRLQDDFAGASIDTNKWQVNNQPFETGVGTFTVAPSNGVLVISGTKDLPLSVEIDRVSIDPTSSDTVTPSTAARTGIFLATGDRSKFLFFGQDLGETGWEVNTNPGNPTGGGTAIPAFATVTDTNSHHLKLVGDGEDVDVYLDNQSGGRFDFPVSSGIYVEVGAYARITGDAVRGVFDNAKIENVLPCISAIPTSVSAIVGQTTNTVTVTIPKLLNATSPAAVTVTSSDANVAVPQGAVNGSLTLNFLTGGTNVQTFNVNAVGLGTATFTLSNGQGACVAGSVAVTVTTVPATLFSDNFSSGVIDSNKWVVDSVPLVDGVASMDSAVTVSNQAVKVFVTANQSTWPGLALATVKHYSASTTSPVSFEVDRVKLDFVLVNGTSAKQRTGLWITDSTRSNYVFFSEYATHDGTAGGWQYHRNIGQAGDNPVTGNGTGIAAFAAAQFNDQGNHHVKAVANGSTVKLYLDGVLGAEVPFPVAQGIVFEFGAYVQAANDIVTGVFDNAIVVGTAPSLGPLAATRQVNGNVVINWTGAGTLQSTDSLSPLNWLDVTPAPVGNSIAVTPQAGSRFYRLR